MELTRKIEDYLEAIFTINRKKGYVKVRDVALYLKIKPPSVSEMAKKLDDMGLVVYKKYDGVTLAPKGKEIGALVRDRHETIRSFLEIIGVPPNIADEDACIIEHELNPETMMQIKNLVKFVKTAPDYPKWLDHFETFCNTEKHSCEAL